MQKSERTLLFIPTYVQILILPLHPLNNKNNRFNLPRYDHIISSMIVAPNIDRPQHINTQPTHNHKHITSGPNIESHTMANNNNNPNIPHATLSEALQHFCAIDKMFENIDDVLSNKSMTPAPARVFALGAATGIKHTLEETTNLGKYECNYL